MSLRILVISQRFWPEETKINDICRGFTDRDCKVDVLCGQPNYPDGKYYPGYSAFGHNNEKHDRMRLFRGMEISRDGGSGIRILLNYYSFAISAFFKILLLQKKQYDAILIYQQAPVMTAWAGLRLGKKKRIPVTIYAVDVWPYSFYQEMELQSTVLRTIFMNLSKKCYRKADKIITASQNAVRFFTSELQIPGSRVSYVPLCADDGVGLEVKDVSVMENYAGSFNLVCAGRLDATNDFDTLFTVAKELIKVGIGDIKFILTGRGPLFASLKKKVSDELLNDVIFFEQVDRPSKMLKFYHVANAFISLGIPSTKGEYTPITEVVDYMTAGRPVIAASGSLERHLVKQARCGLTPDAGDPKALFEAILRLYKSSRQELLKYGENAREYSKEHFNREDRIDDILDIMFIDKTMREDGFIISQKSNIIKMEDD